MEDRNHEILHEQNPGTDDIDSDATISSNNKTQDSNPASGPPNPALSPLPNDEIIPRYTFNTLFHTTRNFGTQKITQFIASKTPEQIGQAALSTSLLVAKSSLKFAQSTASYGITKLQESDIPTHISEFLSAHKRGRGRKRKTSWRRLPKEVYRWCRTHPKELRTAGYVLAGGMLIYNPSLLVGALGLRRKGVMAASVADKMKRVVGVASSIPVALKAIDEVRNGGVGAAAKLAMRKMRRVTRGRNRRR